VRDPVHGIHAKPDCRDEQDRADPAQRQVEVAVFAAEEQGQAHAGKQQAGDQLGAR
jgi:hypothetical protein